MKKRDKLFVLIPAFWASLFDITITIVYQKKEYWDGNLNMVNEGNPIGNFMMKNHVSGIFVISIMWLILIGVFGYYLPRKLSQIFLLFVLITHSWAASTWIFMEFGFWFVIVFILFNSILFYKIDDKINRKISKSDFE